MRERGKHCKDCGPGNGTVVCHEMCFTISPRGALTYGYVPFLLVALTLPFFSVRQFDMRGGIFYALMHTHPCIISASLVKKKKELKKNDGCLLIGKCEIYIKSVCTINDFFFLNSN